jgi:hypothetical protein
MEKQKAPVIRGFFITVDETTISFGLLLSLPQSSRIDSRTNLPNSFSKFL